MLSTLPQLLTFGLIAPFLLRVTVGIYGLSAGWSRYKKPYKWTSVLYFAIGILVIIGLYTQLAVLAGLVILILDYYLDKKSSPLTTEQKMFRFLCAIILISLLFTGPGFLAFDLPL